MNFSSRTITSFIILGVALSALVAVGALSFPEAFLVFGACVFVFSRRSSVGYLQSLDSVSYWMPVGIFLGRIGSFFTGTFYGRATALPWAVIFDTDPTRTEGSSIWPRFGKTHDGTGE